MAIFKWNEEYSVNINEADKQHKTLIATLNELHEAMLTRKSNEIIDSILQRMSDYAVNHFSFEEDLMKKHKYPGYDLHKKEHEAFTAKVSEFIRKHKERRVMLSLEVMNFLKDWLKNHIQGVDKKYGPFLNEKGVS